MGCEEPEYRTLEYMLCPSIPGIHWIGVESHVRRLCLRKLCLRKRMREEIRCSSGCSPHDLLKTKDGAGGLSWAVLVVGGGRCTSGGRIPVHLMQARGSWLGPSVGRGSVAGGRGVRASQGADPEEVSSGMVTGEDVRRVAGSLPRSEEHLIRDHVKFRVGRLVFVSISPDEASMGFAFPREERAALVASEPEKFHMPAVSDERYNWVRVWLDAIDEAELAELVVDAWRMVVPKRVAAAYPGP
jgi:hypothetical protein